MTAQRYVVVEHQDRPLRRGDRVYYTEPTDLETALEQAVHRRDIAAAGGREDTYRVCELLDVGHGGSAVGDIRQAKAALIAHFAIPEPTAHRLIQRTAMDLRIDRDVAARLLLGGVPAALAPAPQVACCDLHNQHCEAPSELCCGDCTEAAHVGLVPHADGSRCVLAETPAPPGEANAVRAARALARRVLLLEEPEISQSTGGVLRRLCELLLWGRTDGEPTGG